MRPTCGLDDEFVFSAFVYWVARLRRSWLVTPASMAVRVPYRAPDVDVFAHGRWDVGFGHRAHMPSDGVMRARDV